MRKAIIILACFLISGPVSFISSYAQLTAVYDNPDAEYRMALELFNRQKFGAAQQKFIAIAEEIKEENSVIKANAEYYSAVCAVDLFHKDAEYLLANFVRIYPGHSKVKTAYFKLAKYQYHKKKYRRAIKSFEKIDIYGLNNTELAEYYFKSGYCHFMLENFDEAKKAFFEVKDTDNRYTSPAKYYYAHIEYSNKNYETALIDFKKLTNDEKFGIIVPYYISQIYFIQGKYDELLEVAPPLLKKATTKRLPEIARFIGESYYRTGRYKEAIPYLEIYHKKSRKTKSREDYYQLGYAYYKTGDCKRGIEAFKKATNQKDSLAQNAYYHIADCYIKNGLKKLALSSFYSAYELKFDEQIQEDALFNYAKLSYELSLNPYNKAIRAFQQYISTYPESKKVDMIYEYLVGIFLSTSNYEDALVSIEKIKRKDDKLKIAYQKIAYNRGVELFNEKNFNEAIKLFDKSTEVVFDQSIRAQSYYWKGEAYNRQKKSDAAIITWKKFLITPGAFILPIYNSAHYNLGYAYFKKKDYESALLHFRKFTGNVKKEPEKIVLDAFIRIGDCYFIKPDFNNAIDFYERAIQKKAVNSDYAMYKKACALGAVSKNSQKVEILQDLIENYPGSHHVIDSKYELAVTYQLLGDNDLALKYYTEIVEKHPGSYIAKSLLKIGMIYYNIKSDSLALKTLERVVFQFPGKPESKEALIAIKNIYVDIDQVDEFLKFIEGISFASVSDTEQDSITYKAVENRYMEGECESALIGFANYLNKFPNGFFIIPANFYKAECEFKEKKIEEALKGYENVLNKPMSKFTETSLLKAAEINYDLKNYERALPQYFELEKMAEYKNNVIIARAGIMRCNYKLNQYKKAIISAKQLQSTPKVSDELVNESHYYIAKCAMDLDSIPLAQTEFIITAKNNKGLIGAEAKYNLAYIQFQRGNLDKTEKMLFKFIQKESSHDYWLAKAFILLADVFIKKDDNFQAKQTLQGIIDNYKGKELIQVASEKLNVILEAEKKKEQKVEEEEIQINLGDENDIFEEEE